MLRVVLNALTVRLLFIAEAVEEKWRLIYSLGMDKLIFSKLFDQVFILKAYLLSLLFFDFSF